MAQYCVVCGKKAYSDYCMRHKPHKSIRQQSDKEMSYRRWLTAVARPFLIERDGERCNCCGAMYEPLDIDHIIGKGTRPDLKKELDNLQLLCRFPCHRNKTDNVLCLH